MPDQDRRRSEAMLRHKILCISAEPSMRRSLKRLMTATGAATEFVSDLQRLPEEPPSLVCVDLRAPHGPPVEALASVFPDKRLICIVGPQDPAKMIECLRLPRCGSVITFDDHFEPTDFIITVTKLLHGQIFGIQKYFPWGVTLYNMDVGGYDDKIKALDVLAAYAELAGARGPVRDRISLVAEELLINGMYHAPVDDEGKSRYRNMPRKELAHQTFDRKVRMSCASNGQHFAVAVRDYYGSLDKETVVKFFGKATQSVLEPENRDSGAGLGLVTALKSASELVFNLAPGVGTEVIALFDLDLMSSGRSGIRSAHIFVERRKPSAPPPEPPRLSLAPLLAGALAVVLIIFGIVGVVRRLQDAPAPFHAEIKVPAEGESEVLPVRIGGSDVRLRVERKNGAIVVRSP